MDRSDIYRHLKHGGDIKTLYKSLEKEIDRAQARIEEENAAEAAKKQTEEEKAVAYANALAALVNYATIAGQTYSEEELSKLLTFMAEGKIIFGTTSHLFSSWLF